MTKTTNRDSLGRADLLAAIREVADDLGHPPKGRTFTEHSDHTYTSVYTYFDGWDEALEAAGLDPSEKPAPEGALGREGVLDAVREVADDLGHPPRTPEFAEHTGRDHSIVYHYFDTWAETIEAAGLDPEEMPTLDGVHRGREKIPREDLLLELEVGAIALGRPPSSYEMRLYGAHSLSTYWERFGSWENALREAGLIPDPDAGADTDADADADTDADTNTDSN